MGRFPDAEVTFLNELRKVLPWNWKYLSLAIDFGTDSFTLSGGVVERFLAAPLPFSELNRSSSDFSQHVFDLQRSSRQLSDRAIYAMTVSWKRGSTPAMEYCHEDLDVTSLAQVKRDASGRPPLFMFKKTLKSDLLRELDPRDVVSAIQTYTSGNGNSGHIKARLLQIVAIQDWLSSVSRGGSDSYFLDGKVGDGGEEAAEELRRVRFGLQAQDESELLRLFDQSLCVYASELDAARRVCSEFGLTPCASPVSFNEEVNRITRAVQALDILWHERTGLMVQRNLELYATD